MTRKTVTAPLTYNPGKGRDKEHLAYLNYQEMQALKRLNGNNMERGPKGLPSFPPSGTTGRSSSTGARGPTGPQEQARSSPAGNKGGAPGASTRTSTTGARGPTGPQEQARTSPAGGRAGAVSRTSGAGFAGVGGGARDSGRASTRGTSPSVPSGGARDANAIRRAQEDRARSAERSPALREDRSRTLNVGPMGMPVRVSTQPGAKISGAVKSVKDLGIAGVPGAINRLGVPAATLGAPRAMTQPRDSLGSIPSSVSAEQYGWSGTGPSKLAAYQGAGIYATRIGGPVTQAQADTLLSVNTSFDPALRSALFSMSPDKRMAAAAAASAAKLQGLDVKTALEVAAAESGFGSIPSRAGSKHKGFMQVSPDVFKEFADKYSKELGVKDTFASAQVGTAYLKSVSDSISKTLGRPPTSGETYAAYQQGVTGFNKLTANPDKLAKDVVGLSKVRSNLKPGDESRAETMTAQEFKEYVSQFPGEKFAEHTGIPTPAAAPSAPVPRPTPRPENLRTAPVSTTAPQKQISDRLITVKTPDGRVTTASTEAIYNELVRNGASPEAAAAITERMKNADVNFYTQVDPTAIVTDPRVAISPGDNRFGSEKLYTDRIAPSFPSGTETAFGGRPSYERTPSIPTMRGATDIASRLSPGIRTPSPSTMRGATAVASRFPMAAVTPFPSSMRAATGAIADLPTSYARLSQDPTAQGRFTPAGGMSFTGTPNQMFAGAAVPGRPYDVRTPRPIGGMSFTGLPSQMFKGAAVPGRPYDIQRSMPAPEPIRPYDIRGTEKYATPRDRGAAEIAIGGTLTTVNDFVDSQENMTPKQMASLRKTFVDSVDEGVVEWTTEEAQSLVKNAKRDAKTDERDTEAETAQDEAPTEYTEAERETIDKIVDDKIEQAKTAIKRTPAGALTAEAYERSVKAKIDAYLKATPSERLAMEMNYPEMIRWASIIGERPQRDYSEYTNWAENRGLRSPADISRGEPMTPGGQPRGGEPGTSAPTPPSATMQLGRRPEIYYMWDLGVNIPSPGDPNYTQYQTYLAERVAAQRAMGYI